MKNLKIINSESYTKLIELGFEFDDKTGKYKYKTNTASIYINAWNGKIYIHSNIQYTDDFEISVILYEIFRNFELKILKNKEK